MTEEGAYVVRESEGIRDQRSGALWRQPRWPALATAQSPFGLSGMSLRVAQGGFLVCAATGVSAQNMRQGEAESKCS